MAFTIECRQNNKMQHNAIQRGRVGHDSPSTIIVVEYPKRLSNNACVIN